MTDDKHKHACELEVVFRTASSAEHAVKVLQVDKEPTDRVTKSFQLKSNEQGETCMLV